MHLYLCMIKLNQIVDYRRGVVYLTLNMLVSAFDFVLLWMSASVQPFFLSLFLSLLLHTVSVAPELEHQPVWVESTTTTGCLFSV